MTDVNRQIIDAFEVQGLAVEAISIAFGFDCAEIKTVLAQFSSKYRKEVMGTGSTDDFTDDDSQQVMTVMRNLALYSDDPNLQFRACKYIRDDKKGRKDVALKNMRGLNINVTLVQEQMKRARAALGRAKVIDV